MTALGRLEALTAAAHGRVAAATRRRTYGVLDYAGEAGLRPPYAAVLPLAEDARENLAPGADPADGGGFGPTVATQLVETTVAVVCCVGARRSPALRQLDDAAAPSRESDADETLEALVGAVRAALLGWSPGAGWWPLELGRGRLLAMEGGRAHWQDDYRSRYLLVGGGVEPADGPAVSEVCAVDARGAEALRAPEAIA